jgi:hypothetical protein
MEWAELEFHLHPDLRLALSLAGLVAHLSITQAPPQVAVGLLCISSAG